LDFVLQNTYTLVLRVVNSKENNPIKDITVKVFRLEKESITLNQWTENLKNGTPFKRLIFSANTDNNGDVTVDLPEDIYEATVEKYGLTKVCELTKNTEVLFVEPKKHWW
jgi:hypothetical protein